MVYSIDVLFQKSFQVSLGHPRYRVVHGGEILYEGNNLRIAIDEYNKIDTIPNPDEAPKTN